jgi:tripeptidyl-peptidase I
MQLGVRGVSLLYASGDGGVSGMRLSQTCTTFVPTFPSACPFVTSVSDERVAVLV